MDFDAIGEKTIYAELAFNRPKTSKSHEAKNNRFSRLKGFKLLIEDSIENIFSIPEPRQIFSKKSNSVSNFGKSEERLTSTVEPKGFYLRYLVKSNSKLTKMIGMFYICFLAFFHRHMRRRNCRSRFIPDSNEDFSQHSNKKKLYRSLDSVRHGIIVFNLTDSSKNKLKDGSEKNKRRGSEEASPIYAEVHFVPHNK